MRPSGKGIIERAYGAHTLGAITGEPRQTSRPERHVRHPRDDRLLPITPRQHQVWSLFALGATRKEVARLLGISQETIRYHMERVHQRIGTRSLTEAVCAYYGNIPYSQRAKPIDVDKLPRGPLHCAIDGTDQPSV